MKSSRVHVASSSRMCAQGSADGALLFGTAATTTGGAVGALAVAGAAGAGDGVAAGFGGSRSGGDRRAARATGFAGSGVISTGGLGVAGAASTSLSSARLSPVAVPEGGTPPLPVDETEASVCVLALSSADVDVASEGRPPLPSVPSALAVF